MKILIALALLVLAVSAQAQTPAVMNTGLSWTAPTQYTDNTNIVAGDITAYTVKCGTASGTYPMSLSVAGTVTSRTAAQLITGMGLNRGVSYFCVVTATTKNGKESANSTVANFVIPDNRIPKAPTLSIQ